MRPEVRKFTRSNPCTKKDVASCFYRGADFVAVQVDAAHALIGVFTPREMTRAGRLVKVKGSRQDEYQLTYKGRVWLQEWLVAQGLWRGGNHGEDGA